jgi:hypothetical protein
MMATRTFCSVGVLALATIVGPVAPGYAGEPCCDWVYGKYINLKTGKEVKPPKGAVAPGSVGSAASAADRYCRSARERCISATQNIESTAPISHRPSAPSCPPVAFV